MLRRALFDTYVMVDWSAAAVPRLGKDSIWIAALRRRAQGLETLLLENLATRHDAHAVLRGLFIACLARGERVLAGFDFPFAYPRGLAERLGLAGAPWRAIWDEIAGLLEDDPHNRNNRFAVASTLNRRLTSGTHPFWGCPAGAASAHLQPRHHRRHSADDFPEHRLVEARMRGPQPCWKLAGTGSAGGQALTGIPVLRALRDDPALGNHVRVWPFETGLTAPERDRTPRVILAEIYPSMVPTPMRAGEVKDSAQVRHIAAHFAGLDARGALASLLAGDPSLTRDERRQVEREEGWVLGVAGDLVRRVDKRSLTLPTLMGRVPPSPAQARERGLLAPRPRSGVEPRSGSTRHPSRSDGWVRGPGKKTSRYDYLRDPDAIYRRSFALIRREIDLSRVPRALHPLALRLVHATGEPALVNDLRWSTDAAPLGRSALAAGVPILVDAEMVAAGIMRDRLPRKTRVLCRLNHARVRSLARKLGTTRSAAAVELWRPNLAGAIVAIGNAPTALFHLLQMIGSGAPKPALILGFPVGFVGAAEAKRALAENPFGLDYVTLLGRRGGSALAAAAVNALAEPSR